MIAFLQVEKQKNSAKLPISTEKISAEKISAKIFAGFFSNWNFWVLMYYKRKFCQMKQQVKRRSLSIYLGVGVSGQSPKKRPVTGTAEGIGRWYGQDQM